MMSKGLAGGPRRWQDRSPGRGHKGRRVGRNGRPHSQAGEFLRTSAAHRLSVNTRLDATLNPQSWGMPTSVTSGHDRCRD